MLISLGDLDSSNDAADLPHNPYVISLKYRSHGDNGLGLLQYLLPCLWDIPGLEERGLQTLSPPPCSLSIFDEAISERYSVVFVLCSRFSVEHDKT